MCLGLDIETIIKFGIDNVDRFGLCCDDSSTTPTNHVLKTSSKRDSKCDTPIPAAEETQHDEVDCDSPAPERYSVDSEPSLQFELQSKCSDYEADIMSDSSMPDKTSGIYDKTAEFQCMDDEENDEDFLGFE
jgi:hypothetical protein